MRKIYLLLVVASALLAGCLSFLGPITKEHKIIGMPLNETILIIDEDFIDGATRVPAGSYYPDSTFSRGVANYVGTKPLAIKLMGFMNKSCIGGASAELQAPLDNYKLFLYNCGNERVITYDIPKRLKFRIVRNPNIPPGEARL
jgi:hypothetical protein